MERGWVGGSGIVNRSFRVRLAGLSNPLSISFVDVEESQGSRKEDARGCVLLEAPLASRVRKASLGHSPRTRGNARMIQPADSVMRTSSDFCCNSTRGSGAIVPMW